MEQPAQGHGTAAGGRGTAGGEAVAAESLPPTEAAARLLALVESQLAAVDPPPCPGCGLESHYRWGKLGENGGRRWRCRACGRTFTARTGTLLAGRHAPEKLRHILLDMFEPKPRSCRRLGADLGLDKTTVWSWRRQLGELLDRMGREVPPDGPSALETVRESRKASREWASHRRDPQGYPAPDRLRWIDYAQRRLPLPDPMTPYLVEVLIGGRGEAGVDRPGHLMGSAGADTERVAPLATSPPARPRSDAGPAARDAVVLGFRRFIRAFRGPATRHLAAYVAWFAARGTALMA